MDGDEGAEGFQGGAGLEGLFGLISDGEGGLGGIGHGDGERDELGAELDVADGEAGVAAPDVHDGGAAAVVSRVHTQEVLLLESGLQGQDPVGAIAVGAALVGPEGGLAAGGVEGVAVAGPALDLEVRFAGIGVGHVEEGGVGEFVVDGDGEGLTQAWGFAGDFEAASGAELVAHGAGVLAAKAEVPDLGAAGREPLGGRGGAEFEGSAGAEEDDTAVEEAVELDAESFSVHAGDGLSREGGGEQGEERKLHKVSAAFDRQATTT